MNEGVRGNMAYYGRRPRLLRVVSWCSRGMYELFITPGRFLRSASVHRQRCGFVCRQCGGAGRIDACPKPTTWITCQVTDAPLFAVVFGGWDTVGIRTRRPWIPNSCIMDGELRNDSPLVFETRT